MDLMWQARELSESGIRASLNQDREAENAIREGSRALLKELWRNHPNRMRQFFHKGMAQIPESESIVPTASAPKLKREKPSVSVIPTVGIALAKSVAMDFGMTRSKLMSPGRQQELIAARAIVAKILHLRGWSLPRIAAAIGRADHSTVANLLERVDYLVGKVPGASASYERNLAEFLPEAVKRG